MVDKFTLNINQFKILIMVIIEEEKLEELVRRALKTEVTAIFTKQGNAQGGIFNPVLMEELQTILTRLNLFMDNPFSDAVKKEF